MKAGMRSKGKLLIRFLTEGSDLQHDRVRNLPRGFLEKLHHERACDSYVSLAHHFFSSRAFAAISCA
jgi:hypothetical protein